MARKDVLTLGEEDRGLHHHYLALILSTSSKMMTSPGEGYTDMPHRKDLAPVG